MTETKTIVLAGNEIEVPRFTLGLNLEAYPLCRKLTNAGYPERYITAAAANAAVEVSNEEFADLAQLAFLGAKAVDPTLVRADFDGWTVAPPELLDAFFPLRLQTGGWVAGAPKEGEDDTGEAEGAKKPPK
jgi:hypothetical protein